MKTPCYRTQKKGAFKTLPYITKYQRQRVEHYNLPDSEDRQQAVIYSVPRAVLEEALYRERRDQNGETFTMA